ncbi:hypothetical protein EYF80_013597 [Liparis tanakae]|uniref:Uncharacterized protein n=1 Tax=Liparis tanakae TaxID=230148 RepID=A0A4Z2IDN7_9TELE|nr:hypothetical protein EYF80_013597 [Liparis tanakae]
MLSAYGPSNSLVSPSESPAQARIRAGMEGRRDSGMLLNILSRTVCVVCAPPCRPFNEALSSTGTSWKCEPRTSGIYEWKRQRFGVQERQMGTEGKLGMKREVEAQTPSSQPTSTHRDQDY